MQRALIAGVILAFLLGVMGVFVSLRKMSFFADGIAHASLLGIAVGIVGSFTPLWGAIGISILLAVLIYLIEQKQRLSSDTAIGIIFTTGMSLGVILISFAPGYQPELISFLFGNILSISTPDIVLIAIITALILIFVFSKLKDLTIFSFNRELALTSGIKVNLLQLVLYVSLAVSVVMAVKMLGVILASALLIIPVATAQIWSRSFRRLLVYSVLFAEASVLAGLLLSYRLDLPTGPTIVVTAATLFLLSLFKPR